MIKKYIKPLNFITVFKSPGVYIIETDITIQHQPQALLDQFPNTWQVNLGGQERLILDGDGDMRITGRMHALGSVMWNQETGTLQFWDGNIWQNINFNLPPN